MNKESTFEIQLERLKEITGCSTQTALAIFFDINPSAIAIMCRKRRLSSTVLLKLVEIMRVNPAWIKTGCGTKYFGLSKPEISPEKIAKSVITSPDILSLIPSSLLIREVFQRSDDLQREYDSRMGKQRGATRSTIAKK